MQVTSRPMHPDSAWWMARLTGKRRPLQSRAVREYLDALDNDPCSDKASEEASTTDPMTQWAGDKGPGQFYYCTNYLIDIEHNVILDVEPTPGL